MPAPPQSGNSICVGGRTPIEGVAACRRGSEASPLGGVPRGVSPLGDSLVTFSSGRKSPRARGWKPRHEGVQRGHSPLALSRSPPGAEHGKAMLSRSARSRGVQRGSAPRIVGRRDPRPCKIPRGAGLKRSRNRKKVVAKKANLYDNKGEPK